MASQKNKPFYKSKTILALIAGVLAMVVLPRLGYPMPEEYVAEIQLAIVSLVVVGLRDGNGSKLQWFPSTKSKEDETYGAG